MQNFHRHIIYVDESGDHGSLSPDYPIFVLVFCIFEKDTYTDSVVTELTRFKFKYFGHDEVVLHERDIRKAQGPFRILQDSSIRMQFMTDLSDIIEAAPFTAIASVINKDQLLLKKERFDVYELAMKHGIERVGFHSWSKESDETLFFIAESRGKKEDKALELEFRRICDGQNYKKHRYPFGLVFANKKARHPGMELADLIARPIGRHVLNPSQPNRAWRILEKKLRRDENGRIEGYGLKIFP